MRRPCGLRIIFFANTPEITGNTSCVQFTKKNTFCTQQVYRMCLSICKSITLRGNGEPAPL